MDKAEHVFEKLAISGKLITDAMDARTFRMIGGKSSKTPKENLQQMERIRKLYMDSKARKRAKEALKPKLLSNLDIIRKGPRTTAN